MTGLISLLVGWGVPAKLAKPVLAVLGGLLILGALWGGKCAYDAHVVANHEAKQEAATAKADRKADNHAAVQRSADEARTTQEADQLQKVRTNAQSNHDRSLARARCIRMQQAARAAKREPPSCAGLSVHGGAASAH